MLTKNLIAAAGNAAEDVAWDLAYAYYDPPSSLAFDLLTTRSPSLNFSFAAQTSTPEDLFVSPDGTRMYMLDSSSVYQYSLSSPWNITTASFVQSTAIGPAGSDVFFKPDGTKMYVLTDFNSKVSQYPLSTAWDISTKGSETFYTILNDGAARQTEGMYIKPDGTKLYVCGQSGGGGTDRQVDEYDLSTAWDVTTATNRQRVLIPLLTSPAENLLMSVSFSSDGTRMFILGQTSDVVIEFPLSTAWDVTTTGSETARYSVAFAQTIPTGLFINSEGSRFVICGNTNDDADQFVMGGFIVSDQDTSPQDIFFKTDGTRMYMLGNSGNDVNEYSLSTAWDIGTATFTQRSGTLAASSPSGLSFKPDGTRMYVLGFSNELVYEYSLSTAWDVSTVTLVRSFSVTTQEPEPTGLYFKPDDGTKMYVGGRTSGVGAVGRIHEYSLSTGWDVSTATFVRTLSVTAQEQVPTGISFKPDGSKMFIDGYLSDAVHEYDLSTAWNISTAIFSKSFSMKTESLLCTGLYMKDDGTTFYVPDSTQDRIFTYSIGEQ